MTKPQPLIPTADVRRLSRFATIGRKIVFGVAEILQDFTDPQAEAFIRGILSALRDDQFVETTTMTYGVGDVYGVRNEQGDWYLKVIQRSGVTVVSCHRPEHAMTTVGGEVVGVRR